jgi:hypothetical protein
MHTAQATAKTHTAKTVLHKHKPQNNQHHAVEKQEKLRVTIINFNTNLTGADKPTFL